LVTKAKVKRKNFFNRKGYFVVARNYRYKRSEIDLIVQKENWLVFVEGEIAVVKGIRFPGRIR
jgi:Holliday junction resolvase-like predicted endonuclease